MECRYLTKPICLSTYNNAKKLLYLDLGPDFLLKVCHLHPVLESAILIKAARIHFLVQLSFKYGVRDEPIAL